MPNEVKNGKAAKAGAGGRRRRGPDAVGEPARAGGGRVKAAILAEPNRGMLLDVVVVFLINLILMNLLTGAAGPRRPVRHAGAAGRLARPVGPHRRR